MLRLPVRHPVHLLLAAVLFAGCKRATPPVPAAEPVSVDEAPPPHWSVPLESWRNLLVIQVEDPSGAKHPFFLDTGASFTVIDPTIADAFEPRPYRDEDGDLIDGLVQTSGPGPVDIGSLQVLPKLSLGEVEMTGEVGAYIADLAVVRRVTGRPIVGVLGFQALQVPFVLDYPGRELRIFETLPEQEGEGTALIETDMVHHPVIEVALGESTVPLLIDTGSGSCFTLPREVALAAGLTAEPVPTGYAQTMGGVIEERSARLSGTADLGGHPVTQPVVDLAAAPGGHIGGAVLHQFSLAFDPAAKRVWFSPVSELPATCEGLRTIGFAVARENDAWVVVLLLPGFQDAGVQPGDVLVELQGQDVRTMDKPSMRALWFESDEVEVAVERAGEVVRMTLPVTTLVP